MSNQIAFRS